MTLRCALDPNPAPPVVVYFKSGIDLMTILCVLEPNNGTCKNTSVCSTRYNYANCLNGTVFSIEINVPKSWNGTSIQCQTFFSTSNYINFSVKGMCKTVFELKTNIYFLIVTLYFLYLELLFYVWLLSFKWILRVYTVHWYMYVFENL